MANFRVRIDPKRLPAPILPPTRTVMTPEKPDHPYEYDITKERLESQSAERKKERNQRRKDGMDKGRRNRKAIWTAKEEAQVWELHEKGYTLDEISGVMGRPPSGVENRLRKIRREKRKAQ